MANAPQDHIIVDVQIWKLLKPIPSQLLPFIQEIDYYQLQKGLCKLYWEKDPRKFERFLAQWNQMHNWNGGLTGIQINYNEGEVMFDFLVGLGGTIGPIRPFFRRKLRFHIPTILGHVPPHEGALVTVLYDDSVIEQNVAMGL